MSPSKFHNNLDNSDEDNLSDMDEREKIKDDKAV